VHLNALEKKNIIRRVYRLRLIILFKSPTYHERKGDGCRFNLLDTPHSNEAGELNYGEQMNPPCFTMSQVDVIRLILDWHEQDGNTFNELKHTTLNVPIDALLTLFHFY
jgi:hypothetical protein